MRDAAFYSGVDMLERSKMGCQVLLTLLDGGPVPSVVIVVVEVAGGLFGNPVVDHTLRAQHTARKIQRVCDPCTLRPQLLQKPVLGAEHHVRPVIQVWHDHAKGLGLLRGVDRNLPAHSCPVPL